MASLWEMAKGTCGQLAYYVAPGSSPPSVAMSTAVLCHGFPVEPDSASRTGRSYPALADRLAQESGWRVLTGCLRGVGPSEGDFSLSGWLEDLGSLTERATQLAAGGGVWLVGFGTGGSLSICLAGSEAAGKFPVRGAASLGGSSSFAGWGRDVKGMAEFAKSVGVIKSDGFPSDLEEWGRSFIDIDPLAAAARISPRPLLVVHGTDDDGISTEDARSLIDAGGPGAELHLLGGGSHRLRADPRAIALLIGWLERQRPS